MVHVRLDGLFGAGNGIRTRDLCLGKATLYQLSYSRDPFLQSSKIVESCQCA